MSSRAGLTPYDAPFTTFSTEDLINSVCTPMPTVPVVRPPSPANDEPPPMVLHPGQNSAGSNRSTTSSRANGSKARPAKRSLWEVEESELQMTGPKLGEGYFGVVIKAKWREMEVCVKRLKNVRKGEFQNFWSEVSIASDLRCPYLVQFLGACTKPGKLFIISEYMRGGSLASLLHDRHIKLAVQDVVRLAKEIALGMNYLHALTPPVLHRDLNAGNVLLDSQYTAKVGDFGLSQVISADEMGAGGHLCYMAPESYLKKQYTKASDVYSYGILLWEIVAAVRPFAALDPAEAVRRAAKDGLRPNFSAAVSKARAAQCPMMLLKLVEICWSQDPQKRPSFSQIVQALRKMEKKLFGASAKPTPLQLSLLSDQATAASSANDKPTPTTPPEAKSIPDSKRPSAPKPSSSGAPPLRELARSFDVYPYLPAHIDAEVSQFRALLMRYIGGSGQSQWDTKRSSSTPTGDDTKLQMDYRHTCGAYGTCRWHEAPMPSPGDVVMCRVASIAENGAVFKLIEYDGLTGMASLTELSRRRIRSISKIVRVGNREVLRVLRVDKKGYVDLSKKDLTPEVIQQCDLMYRRGKCVHDIMTAVANNMDLCLTCLYLSVGWPLARRFGSIWDAFRLALEDPAVPLGRFTPCVCFGNPQGARLTLTPRLNGEIERRLRQVELHGHSSLDLSRLGLDRLPPVLGSHAVTGSLKQLNLEENSLVGSNSLTASVVQELVSLEELNLNSCGISELPVELATCTRIARLYMFGNQLSEVPPVVTELSNLEQLNLKNNQLNSLPDLSSLLSLKEFTLGQNQLTSLPESFALLRHLRVLDLSRNFLQEFPAVICSLSRLTSLELKENMIQTVPPEISNLVCLEYLDLSGNNLQELPWELVLLVPDAEDVDDSKLSRPSSASTSPATSPFARPRADDQGVTTVATVAGSNAPPRAAPGHTNDVLSQFGRPLQHMQDPGAPAGFPTFPSASPFGSGTSRLSPFASSFTPTIPRGSPPVSDFNPQFLRYSSTESSSSDPGNQARLRTLDVRRNPHLVVPQELARRLHMLKDFLIGGLADVAGDVHKALSVEVDGSVVGDDMFAVDDLPSLLSDTPTPVSGTGTYHGHRPTGSSGGSRNGMHMHTGLSTPSPLESAARAQSAPMSAAKVPDSAAFSFANANTGTGATQTGNFLQWDVNAVSQWLQRIGLGEYAAPFQDNAIDGSVLVDLDKTELKEMGVRKIGHQKRLLKAIKQLQEPQPVPASSTTPGALPRAPSQTSLDASQALTPPPPPPRAARVSRHSSGGVSPGTTPVLRSSLSARSSSSNDISESPLRQYRTSLDMPPTTPQGCDMGSCEVVRSCLLHSVLESSSLRRPQIVRAVVMVTTLRGGVEALKNVLRCLRAVRGAIYTPFEGLMLGDRSSIDVKLVFSPLYLLSVPCLVVQHGVDVCERAIEVLRQKCSSSGGVFRVIVAPYEVTFHKDEIRRALHQMSKLKDPYLAKTAQ